MARIKSKKKHDADMWLVALVACIAIIAMVLMSGGLSFGTMSSNPITGRAVATASETCFDHDGGLDYYAFSSITGPMPRNFDAYDRCVSKTILWETYCDSEGYGSGVQFTCPRGCEAGRCKAAN